MTVLLHEIIAFLKMLKFCYECREMIIPEQIRGSHTTKKYEKSGLQQYRNKIILKIHTIFQPLTTDGPLKSHLTLPEIHEKVIKEIIYEWLNMYVTITNHSECNFFPLLPDLTLS